MQVEFFLRNSKLGYCTCSFSDFIVVIQIVKGWHLNKHALVSFVCHCRDKDRRLLFPFFPPLILIIIKLLESLAILAFIYPLLGHQKLNTEHYKPFKIAIAEKKIPSMKASLAGLQKSRNVKNIILQIVGNRWWADGGCTFFSRIIIEFIFYF